MSKELAWCFNGRTNHNSGPGARVFRRVLDAAKEGYGEYVALMAVDHSDAGVSITKVSKSYDMSDVLRLFAAMCALEVAELWRTPDEVLDYLATGDEQPRATAEEWFKSDSAREVAEDANEVAECSSRGRQEVLAFEAARSAVEGGSVWQAWDAASNAAKAMSPEYWSRGSIKNSTAYVDKMDEYNERLTAAVEAEMARVDREENLGEALMTEYRMALDALCHAKKSGDASAVSAAQRDVNAAMSRKNRHIG